MNAVRIVWVLIVIGLAAPASAQTAVPPATTHTGPAMAWEILGGYAGFVDESLINHGVIGGAARVQLGSRISVGPELTWMIGPGDDRDLFVLGNLTFDFVPQSPGYPSRVSPYLIAGAGLFRHSDRFGNETFASNEGAFAAGGGVRVMLSERAYAAVDARGGWETHLRVTAAIGMAIR